MKRIFLFAVSTVTVLALCQIVIGDTQATWSSTGDQSYATESAQKQMASRRTGMMPISFTENRGQWVESVRFQTRAGRALIWFTSDGTYYHFMGRVPIEDRTLSGPKDMAPYQADHQTDSIEHLVLKASFIGAADDAIIVGEGVTDHSHNYFIGSDPDKWQTDVPSYEGIVFKNLYEGIDLKYYFDGTQLEYDFIVSPGADPGQIEVEYDGTQSIRVNDDGQLVVETDWATVTELQPVVYQRYAGELTPVKGRYVLLSDRSFGFALDETYDPSLALVIDPVLVFSTYLGGDDRDEGRAIAVDESGYIYVTGYTSSTDFPTEGPYQTHQEDDDVFITKLSASGESVVYSTYLGGDSIDECYGIAIDGSGCAYVTGRTYSADFPTQNPYQTDLNSYDVFVTKLSASGNSLVYSTYLGGDSNETSWGIAVDGSDFAYVTGGTWSTDFPTKNPFQGTHQGKDDLFLTKLSVEGDTLVFSTFLGGSFSDHGQDVVLDGSGFIYVCGQTASSDFPTENPYQSDYGGFGDVIIAKLDPAGDALVYSTYLGGVNGEIPDAIGIDDVGCAYVMGTATSSGFPLKNPYQTDQGDWDMFLAKLADTGDMLVYSTYLGGNDREEGYGLAISGDGYAYVVGRTTSSDFPTQNPYQATYQNGFDGTITRFSISGQSLVYSTYLGGGLQDQCQGIAIDGNGFACVTGLTVSDDFPIQNPYQATLGSPANFDAFVTKLECTSNFVVSTLDDSGPGSLREAIEVANASETHDTISFSVSGTIEVLTPLPVFDGDGGAITDDGFVILGATAPGGAHSVILDGSALSGGDGLTINSNNCGSSRIDGLTIRNFTDNGITVIATDPPVWHAITNNLIYDNGGLAIDIGDDGVTQNDWPDEDEAYNFPEIDSVRMQPDKSFQIHGRAPDSDVLVEFYIAHPARDITKPADPSGHGEAYSYVGADTSEVDGSFIYTVDNSVEFFTEVTATATYSHAVQMVTSEFSENFTLVPGPLVVYGYSPINIVVIDPNGYRFGKYGDETPVAEISPADYFEEPDIDSVVIYYPIEGTYILEVYGTTEATPGTTYSMGVRINGSTQAVVVNEDEVPLYGMPPDEVDYEVEEGWHYVNGDADRSGDVDIDDVVYLIAYIFTGGPPPDPLGAGDADCSYDVDIDDVVYLIAYIFSGGPAPCMSEE